jgi:hypothetical protein
MDWGVVMGVGSPDAAAAGVAAGAVGARGMDWGVVMGVGEAECGVVEAGIVG